MIEVKTFETTNTALFNGGFNNKFSKTVAVFMNENYTHDPTAVTYADVDISSLNIFHTLENVSTYLSTDGKNTILAGDPIEKTDLANDVNLSGFLLLRTQTDTPIDTSSILFFIDLGGTVAWTKQKSLVLSNGFYFFENLGL